MYKNKYEEEFKNAKELSRKKSNVNDIVEDKLSKYCNNSAATCSSGTSALLMAYEQVGIGPGDKVIVPSWTFISTAEMITKLGATPVWVDVNMHDYTIDIEDLERKITKLRCK